MGLLRLIAIVLKTTIEMLWPTITLLFFAMDNPVLIPQTDHCGDSSAFVLSIKLFCIFPLGFTFLSHFPWSFILNLSNKEERSVKEVFFDTFSWIVYNYGFKHFSNR